MNLTASPIIYITLVNCALKTHMDSEGRKAEMPMYKTGVKETTQGG